MIIVPSLIFVQRDSSPSGTVGQIQLFVNGVAGEVKIDFDCPYVGNNKCDLSGQIHVSGLKLTRP